MLRSSVGVASSLRGSVASSVERPLVLVVDPDRSARAVLEVALSRDGFDVWSAETADQGLAVLRRGRTPDVIVLESDLGEGDGFSFCAQLRGDARTARVPVVLLARADDANVSNLAEVVGVDEAVQKPAFARDVVALVRLELVRSRSTTGAALRFGARTLPPAHLLRALLTSARSGTLALADGQATVQFSEGAIVEARFGSRWGIDALVRALSLTTADYTVSLEAVVRTTGFTCSLRDFVAQVLPRLSKWGLVAARSLPLDAVLAVDFGRLARALPTMPDDVNRVVQLFDGRRRVYDVLLDSHFDELLTLEVATRLYLMGVVGPVAGSEGLDEALRAAPALFEPRSAEADDLMRQLFEGVTEIRAADVEPALVDDADWVVPPATNDLEVDDPAGGWQAAAIPDSHVFDGVEDEVARTLAAFNTPTVVEPVEVRPEVKPVEAFAQGAATADDSLEAAFRSATGDEDAEAVMVGDPTPPSPTRRFTAEDRQDRIVTPVLTPVVQVDAPAVPRSGSAQEMVASSAAPALMLQPAIPSVVEQSVAATLGPVTPPTAVPAPASDVVAAAARPAVLGKVPVRVVKDVPAVDPEAAFFASEPPEALAFEETLPSHAAAKPRRVGVLLLALAVAALVVAVIVEWALSSVPAELPVPVAAALVPPQAPEPAPPAPAVELEPVAVPEAEPLIPESIDVSEALADGLRAYQRGEYATAIAVLEQVVADDPKSLQGWLVLGQARYDAGDARGAREAAGNVLNLDAKHAGVHVLLATLAYDAGDKATMKQELETYLLLEPEGPHAAEARALLRR
jgi:DNA-binding response OmpR family regulator